MAAASLNLLKGGAKSTLEEELTKTSNEALDEAETASEGETTEDEEQVSIDIDNMSGAELDALVKEQEIDTPKAWSKFSPEKKRAWLNEQFGEADPEAEAQGEQEAPALTEQQEAAVKATVELETAKAKKDPKPKTSKKKETGTAVATSDLKEGVIEKAGEDPLADVIHEIETLNESSARELVTSLAEQSEFNFFKIGGVLSVIQANDWYKPKYPSMREFIENELGIEYRKATYWTAIYNSLAEAGIPWGKIKTVPWSKLKEIAQIINHDNVDEWVQLAENNNTLTLHEAVKAFKNKDKAITTDETSKTVTTKTFKVHDGQKQVIEQAITKAKDDINTTVDTVALEAICLDYLGGVSIKDRLMALGIEKAAQAIADAFPEANFNVEFPGDEEEAA